jgi:hypothetical protein
MSKSKPEKTAKSQSVSYGAKELAAQMQAVKNVEVNPPVSFANKIQAIRIRTDKGSSSSAKK